LTIYDKNFYRSRFWIFPGLDADGDHLPALAGEDSFDKILKPALYKALKEHSKGKVPEKWATLGDM